jgi:hypothetical protein
MRKLLRRMARSVRAHFVGDGTIDEARRKALCAKFATPYLPEAFEIYEIDERSWFSKRSYLVWNTNGWCCETETGKMVSDGVLRAVRVAQMERQQEEAQEERRSLWAALAEATE